LTFFVEGKKTVQIEKKATTSENTVIYDPTDAI